MNHAQLTEKLMRIKLLAEEGLRDLAVSQRQSHAGLANTGKTSRPRAVVGELDFTLPVRPFVKKYAAGLSGPKKFTLLLARLAEGDAHKEVSLTEIEKMWNGMTSLMGMKFNRFFTQEAKDNDWVETKKKGMYSLRPSWKTALGHA